MKRIQEIDALRGLALFGILLVNIFVFHAPLSYYGQFYGAFEGFQAVTVNLMVDLAAGKFMFIFAFLFGYGIVLQSISRAEGFPTYFAKRMVVLFLFGALHILLFWFGDILASYALLGLLVFPMLKLSNRTVLLLSCFFLLFRPIYYFGVVLLQWPPVNFDPPAELEEFMAVFQHGSYLEVFQLRMKEFFAFQPENLVWYLPKTTGLFLLGIYAARIKLVDWIRRQDERFLATASILILISMVWIYVKKDLFSQVNLEAEPHWRPIFIGFNSFFETTMGIGYIIGFLLVFMRSKALSKLFAATGRMALTNYILQSLICVLIFYGFGGGYYGKLQPTDLVLLVVAIFSLNVAFSHLYLRFRTMGPLEYVWRKLIKS